MLKKLTDLKLERIDEEKKNTEQNFKIKLF